MRYLAFAVMPLVLAACDQMAEQQMQDISDKVATDAEEQYAMARRSGNKIDICVQAGMVSAAWLQAKNEAKYASAKATEERDCAAAGVS